MKQAGWIRTRGLAAVTTSVELDQITDQEQAAPGTPTRVANLGPKVNYYYNGMKVVFKDGKVTDAYSPDRTLRRHCRLPEQT